ncbi:AAA family ATPase [Acuticoccus sp. I52.16.1]|uniref:AAA family ATPase n=1 Tax=Acuticoccus sp. I52.16.1 TaxID=2928472 RepID=UPI001FD5C67D|nr:ATP-binding protein [Acuticoccus sp. I52.16.1]UOM36700.1 ATP-binding protein [Acuticoccus sp. I52.16.1]
MASAAQIISLVRSHTKGDRSRFEQVALQLAADAAKRGHSRVADELRDLIEEARGQATTIEHTRDPIPVVRPKGELAGLLSASFPSIRLSSLVLPGRLSEALKRVVKEQRERDKLDEYGLSPRRKLLLSGPPGTGKTSTAAALSGELSLPLFTIELDGVITKYMGESAAKLRLVFESIANNRGVYFFDELDALGAERSIPNDVGEARRIATAFLKFLEEDRSTSLILAATNHAKLLDKALFRRFDAIFSYELPDETQARAVLENSLTTFDLSQLDWDTLMPEAKGMSHCDIARAAIDAARVAVLEHNGQLDSDLLTAALKDRRTGHAI